MALFTVNLRDTIDVPNELEDELADYILKMEKSEFGTIRRDVRSSVHQEEERNHINHSCSQDNESETEQIIPQSPSFRRPMDTSIAMKGYNIAKQ